MRQTILAIGVVVVLVACVSRPLWAVEQELAGVRLNQKALSVLQNESYRMPDYIGPLGGYGLVQAQPAGPTGAGGTGAYGASPYLGAAPGYRPYPGAGAGYPSLYGGSSAGALPPPYAAIAGAVPGVSAGTAGMAPFSGTAGMAPFSAAAGGLGAAGGPAQELTGLVYWLYQKPNRTKAILGINRQGVVTTITVQGTRYLAATTSRGLTLGDSFEKIVREYGYPDRTEYVGNGLELSYVDHDLKFQVGPSGVTEISIGRVPAPPSQPSQAQPVAPGIGYGAYGAAPVPGGYLPGMYPYAR